jgi:hypothetical protein
MQQFDKFFLSLAESSAINGLADELLDLDCRPKNVQYFSKPPGAKQTPLHQVYSLLFSIYGKFLTVKSIQSLK